MVFIVDPIQGVYGDTVWPVMYAASLFFILFKDLKPSKEIYFFFLAQCRFIPQMQTLEELPKIFRCSPFDERRRGHTPVRDYFLFIHVNPVSNGYGVPLVNRMLHFFFFFGRFIFFLACRCFKKLKCLLVLRCVIAVLVSAVSFFSKALCCRDLYTKSSQVYESISSRSSVCLILKGNASEWVTCANFHIASQLVFLYFSFFFGGYLNPNACVYYSRPGIVSVKINAFCRSGMEPNIAMLLSTQGHLQKQ